VGLEQNGLAAKEINAPEAVLKVTDKRQPGRTVTGIRPWSVVLFKYASDNIFSMLTPNALLICCAIRGQPNRVLRLRLKRLLLVQFDNGIYKFL